ncbi:hypothetical protein F0562_019542 [Nyssa sinensis]|uniref:Uncharacterized protein n=1 Tax=Nyssa sinensis TaxID=561372 RepID=A0A5J5BQ26_9ASTE|nr:hypothetical protein F0562_019542 [Nyssa sinensis]
MGQSLAVGIPCIADKRDWRIFDPIHVILNIIFRTQDKSGVKRDGDLFLRYKSCEERVKREDGLATKKREKALASKEREEALASKKRESSLRRRGGPNKTCSNRERSPVFGRPLLSKYRLISMFVGLMELADLTMRCPKTEYGSSRTKLEKLRTQQGGKQPCFMTLEIVK